MLNDELDAPIDAPIESIEEATGHGHVSGSSPVTSKRKKKRVKRKSREPRASIEELLEDSKPPVQSRTPGVLVKTFTDRRLTKEQILKSRDRQQKKIQRERSKKEAAWRAKTEKSPFVVDLLAETERIEEESKLKNSVSFRYTKLSEKRRNKVKQKIILKAIQEASDLEALRAEKRLILEEEKRLKALLGIEKTKSKRKQDLMAAMRAEKQRKEMQREHRRQLKVKFEQDIKDRARKALLMKHGLLQIED